MRKNYVPYQCCLALCSDLVRMSVCWYKAQNLAFSLAPLFQSRQQVISSMPTCRDEFRHLQLFEHRAVETTHPAQTSKLCRWVTLFDTQVLLYFLLTSHWCFWVLKYLEKLCRRSHIPGPSLIIVTGFKRLVVQRNRRHPWLRWDQTLQRLGQVPTVCSLSTPHDLLVPVRVQYSTEHTVLAQKMKGSISTCACCQHNKKTFLWGHCERVVVARC